MENPELANAAWWLWFWELIGTISFFGVIVTLAVEFGAARLAAPHKERLDRAREERISAANERAAKAELELARLRAPRQLTKDQSEAISAAIRPFGGIKFVLSTYHNDPESSAFAGILEKTVSDAGWKRIPPLIITPLGLASGVFVKTNEVTGSTPDGHATRDINLTEEAAADALVKALNEAGIAAARTEREPMFINPERAAIQITVGKKP